jgi:hypothetical protein
MFTRVLKHADHICRNRRQATTSKIPIHLVLTQGRPLGGRRIKGLQVCLKHVEHPDQQLTISTVINPITGLLLDIADCISTNRTRGINYIGNVRRDKSLLLYCFCIVSLLLFIVSLLIEKQ